MGMFDSDYWNEVWDAIAKNKWRSFFTGMGVFWGIFILVVMSGFGNGLRQRVKGLVSDFAVNSVYFFNGRTSLPYQGFASGRVWQFTNSDIDFIQSNAEGVKTVSGMIFGGEVNTSRGDRRNNYQMLGHMPQYGTIEPMTQIYGRYINEEDMRQKRKVCTIGQDIYNTLFDHGENPLGKTILVGMTYYTVVGVHTPLSDIQIFSDAQRTIIVPFSTLQQAYNKGDKSDMLVVVGYDYVDANKLQENVDQLIRSRHQLSPDDKKAVQGFNLGEEFSVLTNMLLGISILTWFVGAGTLLAGIVGISNIMLVVTKERTHEIGIRRALGATPRVIQSQVIAESFVLTFIAGMIGIFVSVGLLVLIDMALSANATQQSFLQSAQVDFGTVMAAAFILVIGGVAAGIIPSNKALEVKAVDAIREE